MDAKAIDSRVPRARTTERAAAEPVRSGFWGRIDAIPDFPYSLMIILGVIGIPIAAIAIVLKMAGF